MRKNKPNEGDQKEIDGRIITFQGKDWRPVLARAIKNISWNCRGMANPAIVSELRQLLVANF